VTARRLLPHSYPFVDIRCHSAPASSYPRFHVHCRVEGEGTPTLNIIQHHYTSALDAITDIVNNRLCSGVQPVTKASFFLFPVMNTVPMTSFDIAYSITNMFPGITYSTVTTTRWRESYNHTNTPSSFSTLVHTSIHHAFHQERGSGIPILPHD
jgi:hypothetical protein